MDENTGGTPNPLNPSPTAPIDPTPKPDMVPPSKTNEPEIQRPVQRPTQRPARLVAQRPVQGPTRPVVRRSVAVSEVTTPTTAINEEPVEPVNPDPMDRPMMKAPEPEVIPKKKKNTGLIIGIIICLFVAIGCAVAAILLTLNNNSGNAVSKAFSKIINGEAPKNITVNGNIDIAIDEQDSLFSNVGIKLKSDIVLDTLVNMTSATISATKQDGGDPIMIDIDEMYATSGDLYIRLNGIGDAMDDIVTLNNTSVTDVIDCATNGTDDTNCIDDSLITVDCETEEDCIIEEEPEYYGDTSDLIDYLGAFAENPGAVDGEWFRISASSLSALTSEDSGSNLSCLTNLTSDIKANSETITKLYQDNQFLTSSTENIPFSSKRNPIYKLVIDEEKMSDFFTAANSIAPVKNLLGCLGYTDRSLDVKTLTANVTELPDIYTEIDNRDYFTRLLFVTDLQGFDATLTVDLDFSYPSSITVSEPFEYQDLL